MYTPRIKRYVPFDMVELPDIKKRAALPLETGKQKEGEVLLKSVRPSDYLVLLDEKGSSFRSLAFAEWIRGRFQQGKDVVFAIGGAYGFSKEVYARADFKISLSDMTFSHQIIRVIFAEQLYRALTIINGDPYHHE